MKTKQWFQWPCLTSCLALLLVTHSSRAADTTKDEEAIKAVVAAFDKAMNAKDAAAFSRVFHEDADFTNGPFFNPTPGVYDGELYNYKLDGGSYSMDDLRIAGKKDFIVTAPSVLWVHDDIDVHGDAQITIAPGGSLMLYVGTTNVSGASVAIGGNGVRGMTAHGRKAIEAFHRPLFEGDGTKGIPSFKNAVLKIVDTRIRFVRPDVASVDVTWTQTGSVLDGKDRGLRKGLMTWIATKERGTWGIAVMHNMDLPVEQPKAP